MRLTIAVVGVVRHPTHIGICWIDSGFDVTVGNGAIDEVSKRGRSNRPDGAGARIVLASVWRGVFHEGAERSKIPSKNLAVVLDWTDIHHVNRVIVGERKNPMRHVSRTMATAVHVWPTTPNKRCGGRKTRLRASSFNDARVGRGGQPLRKTQLGSGGLVFPNAMGTMRDGALGIEGAKGVGGLEGGISGGVRVTLELVGRVGWCAGVRGYGYWHLAKEGIGLLVTQAPLES